MKIAIIGSSGFIGGSLANYYDNQYSIIKVPKGLNILKSLSEFSPSVIINCAAEIYNKEQMWNSNFELTKMLLDFCLVNNIKFVHFGSSSEYGEVNTASKECMPIDVSSLYSATKGLATLTCMTYAKNYNLDCTVIRPYSPFGPLEKPHRLFPMLWKSFVLNKEMTLKEGMHDFLYIDDLVKAVDLILHSETRGKIYNISSGIQFANSAVLEIFRNITGKRGNVKFVNEMTTPKNWVADISKIKKELNWHPTISLYDGIKLFLNNAKYE